MTVLRMLLPGPADIGDLHGDRDSALQAIADLYAYPDPISRRGWVRANMVSSLDGSVTDGNGRSGGISGAADKAVFGVLRALADVVLVGAGTARAEAYGPPEAGLAFADRRVAAGQPPAAAMAIVTGSGNVRTDTGLFIDSAPTYIVTTARADLARLRSLAGGEHVIVAGDEQVEVGDAVAALAGRGLRRVLLEGGPRLLGDALAAGRVDELCLTWSPVLVGGDGPRVAYGPSLRSGARPAHLICADDVLLGRWLVLERPDT